MSDTNILSELQKGNRCHTDVQHWYAAIDSNAVLMIGEIRLSIERLRRRDAIQADRLEQKLLAVESLMVGRITDYSSPRRTLGTSERSRSLAGYRWLISGYRAEVGFDFNQAQHARCRTFRHSLGKSFFRIVMVDMVLLKR